MKTLGILGGMSWVSTQSYYRLINEGVGKLLGRQHSADLLISSVDFQVIVDAQSSGNWSVAAKLLSKRAQGLEQAGAAAFLIASNTMHLVYDDIRSSVGIPGLNIFDATAEAAKSLGLSSLGLLGTRYTMSDPYFLKQYRDRGIEVFVPNAADALRVNEIIFRELIHNQIKENSLEYYRSVVAKLAKEGAQGVILGCTEIGMLLGPGSCEVPLLDTTLLHAEQAIQWLVEPNR